MQIGKVIRKKRREKELSQEKLAKEVGVSKVTIWAWEKGEYEPTGRMLILVMIALNLELKDFSK